MRATKSANNPTGHVAFARPLASIMIRVLGSRRSQLPSWPNSRVCGDRSQLPHFAQLRVIQIGVACGLETEAYTAGLAESFLDYCRHRLGMQIAKGKTMSG